MEHICTKQKTIEKIENDLNKHIKDQIESDKERMQYRADRQLKDNEISSQLKFITSQVTELIELNKEVKDFKTAWRVGRNIGIGLAVFIATMSAIFGGILAIKEWIKR